MSLFALPGYSWQKSFPEKDYVAYLFTYFTGNSGDEEAVRYAVSMDGYTYWALNDNEPVIDSKVISSTGGVRDPHILRCEDGKTFYMVVTDMVSANGWSSNRAMVLLKSTDLVNWSHSVINIQKRYSGQEDLKRVWAPQTIYDPEVGKYMVYWSMLATFFQNDNLKTYFHASLRPALLKIQMNITVIPRQPQLSPLQKCRCTGGCQPHSCRNS